MNTPVALFVYRRPEHTRRTLAALARAAGAKDVDLHVYSDAARDASVESSVAEVRRVVREIDGFRAVTVTERPANLGLARSIASGVSGLLAAHGSVIVIEDDLEVAPSFLAWMTEALDRFADDSRVRQVSGYMFPVPASSRLPESFFMPLTTSWGWGTWARAWGDGPPPAAELLGRIEAREDRAAFSLNGAYDYLGLLRAAAAGRVDSWAVCWYARTWLEGGLVAYPRASLVRNSGLDGSGTHGDNTAGFEAAVWEHPTAPRMPGDVVPCEEALELVESFLRSQAGSPWRRILGRALGPLGRLMNTLSK
jgi:hypothetical protein